MNDLPIEQSIKEVIRNIFSCSGEPYSISDAVVNVLYKHIRLVANLYATNLKTETPKLADFVHAFRNRPVELLRIAKYFMIVSTSKEVTSATSLNSTGLDDTRLDLEDQQLQHQAHQTEDGDLTDLFNDASRNTGWLRFIETCNKAQIDLPTHQDLFEIELQYTPKALVRGRRLRLSRIDSKTASTSSDDYVSFARLRQSASLLKFVRRRLSIDFWHWLYNHHHHPKTTTTDDPQLASESSLKNPDVREGIRVFAYLLTAHVWDVIDLALSRRQALQIDLRSPLTPIEIKESVRQLQSLLAQTSRDL